MLLDFGHRRLFDIERRRNIGLRLAGNLAEFPQALDFPVEFLIARLDPIPPVRRKPGDHPIKIWAHLACLFLCFRTTQLRRKSLVGSGPRTRNQRDDRSRRPQPPPENKQSLVKEPLSRVFSCIEVVMEYRFTIADSFTPETLPMGRLAEYVAAFSQLLGEQDKVHFRGIEAGSAVLVAAIDAPAWPKIRERVLAVRDGGGGSAARKAFADLDDMLRKDNATGALSDDAGNVVVPFPGRNAPEALIYGPFRQDGTIDGQLIRVGGKDETVPVHLRDGAIIHTGLFCTPEIARRVAPHLFGPTLRVHGLGTWFRTGAGAWEMRNFRINDFEVLDDAPLLTVVENLRKVKGSDWGKLPDPVHALLGDRHGDEGAH